MRRSDSACRSDAAGRDGGNATTPAGLSGTRRAATTEYRGRHQRYRGVAAPQINIGANSPSILSIFLGRPEAATPPKAKAGNGLDAIDPETRPLQTPRYAPSWGLLVVRPAMTDSGNPQVEASRHVARQLLYLSSAKSSAVVDSFLSWLLAVTGAALGLVVSNLGDLESYISPPSVECAALLFLAAAFPAVLQKYISSVVVGSGEAVEKAAELAEKASVTYDDLDFSIIQGEMDKSTLPTTRALKWLAKKVFRDTDLARNTARVTQIQWLLALISTVLLLASISALVLGLQV